VFADTSSNVQGVYCHELPSRYATAPDGDEVTRIDPYAAIGFRVAYKSSVSPFAGIPVTEFVAAVYPLFSTVNVFTGVPVVETSMLQDPDEIVQVPEEPWSREAFAPSTLVWIRNQPLSLPTTGPTVMVGSAVGAGVVIGVSVASTADSSPALTRTVLEYGSYPFIVTFTVWDVPAATSTPATGVTPTELPSRETEADVGVEAIVSHPTCGVAVGSDVGTVVFTVVLSVVSSVVRSVVGFSVGSVVGAVTGSMVGSSVGSSSAADTVRVNDAQQIRIQNRNVKGFIAQ